MQGKGKGTEITVARLRQLETEKDWRRKVIGAAKYLGWRCYFTWLSAHSPAGFPDLVLVRPPRVVFAELKSERGCLTFEQGQWVELLSGCPGVEVYVWRPSDWDRVVAELRR